MSTDTTSLLKFDGVFAGILFKKEVRETFKDKARKHDIITDKNSRCLIWPDLELLNRNKDEVWIHPLLTVEHENALEFFRPLRDHVLSKGFNFYISVKKTDIYTQNLREKFVGNFPLDCVKLLYTPHSYREPLTTWYFFSEDDRHKYCQYRKSEQDCFVAGVESIFKHVEWVYDKSMSPHVSVLMRSKNGDRNYMAVRHGDVEHADFGTLGYNFATAQNVTINDNLFVAAPKDVFFAIFGPIELVAEEICRLKKQSQNYEICYESQMEEYFRLLPPHLSQLHSPWLVSHPSPGTKMRSKCRHNTLVDICLALSFIDAPYVILDIADYLSLFRFTSRVNKVRIIEGVFSSIRKVLQIRSELKS